VSEGKTCGTAKRRHLTPGLQLTASSLRCGFRQQLSPGVAMTSNVKSG